MALTILVLATPSRAWAQPEAHPATLDVCNKGNVPVAAAVATKKGLPPISDYWIIEGIPIAAGACKRIYSTSFADTAYVGFGFADAQGRWTSGTVDDVPDFGSHYYGPVEAALKGALSRPVLRRKARDADHQPRAQGRAGLASGQSG